MGRGGEPHGHGIAMFLVTRHHLEDEVPAAPDHVALADLRPVTHGRLEVRKHVLGLTVEADEGEEQLLVAEFPGVDLGMIALDVAGRLEGTDTAQTRRRRDTGAAGELDIGHPSLVLQIAQDAAVDSVELDSLHEGFSGRYRDLSVLYCNRYPPRNNISMEIDTRSRPLWLR